MLHTYFKMPFLFIAVLLCGSRVVAFSPLSTVRATGSLWIADNFPLSQLTRTSRLGPLRYRELDGDDDESDPAMLKVKSRAPPMYDVQKALQEQTSSIVKQPTDGVNRQLIRALTLNQFLILALATAISATIILVSQGPSGFQNLNTILQWSGGSSGVFDLNLTWERLVWGIGAALPLLAFSNAIENSDNRAFANINFSTIAMCLTLFGRRSVPPDEFLPAKLKGATGASKFPTTKWTEAAIQSFILSTVTGICEEAVFRRLVPAILVLLSGSNGDLLVPYFGQALLFGLRHAQPGKQNLAENGILVGLQTVNGLGFGLLYILTGGDLVPCIIAHATYDFVVFFKTWIDANDQIEYADTMYRKPFPKDVDQAVRKLLRSNSKMDPRRFDQMKRLFYTFDFDKNETLSLSEVRKGVAYMSIERTGFPPPQSEVDRLFTYTVQSSEQNDAKSSRLTFPDFLRFIALSSTKPEDSRKLITSL